MKGTKAVKRIRQERVREGVGQRGVKGAIGVMRRRKERERDGKKQEEKGTKGKSTEK